MFATIDKFGRVKCAVVSYLLVAVFLIPVALEASGTFVWLSASRVLVYVDAVRQGCLQQYFLARNCSLSAHRPSSRRDVASMAWA